MSSENSNAPRNGAELVVRMLEDRGVEFVFGIPGAKIDAVFDALVDSKIQTVACRHEQNAAFIAGGIGRMTGKAGVCIATSGPGVSNLVTGLATANSEGDPVVALGGAVATDEALKHIHQTMDSVAICKPVTKFSAAVGAPQAVAEVVGNAFRAAESGRPGAAFVSLPRDIMSAPAQGNVLKEPAFAGLGPADGASLAEAARLINEAQTPVVLLGLQASKPANAIATRALVAAHRLPVVGTFQAAGAVAAHLMDDFGGRVGQLANQPGDRLLDAADLVITVGYDPVEYWPSLWNKGRDRKIIHIDALGADLDSHYCPIVELIGDIAQSLTALQSLVDRRTPSPVSSKILQTIGEERTRLGEEAARLGGAKVHPLRIVHELQKLLEPDVTLCLDVGSFYLWFALHLYSFRARQVLISNGQQTLGVALPWAIAATLVRPGEKVISISGDGGFLFSSMELETAVRLKSNLVHMVLIDGTYDMVAVQEIAKYGRGSGIELGPVDPVKYAEAFGAVGYMARTADEIGPIMRKALQTQGPVIVGVHVDYSDNHKLFEMVRDDAFH
jgi:acetolactate synthase I/II/III large subunit